MIKKILTKQFIRAYELNHQNILSLLEQNSEAKLLDLGCDDGRWTNKLANRIRAEKVFGIEIVDERIKKAKLKKIIVKKADLNDKFPFADESFDVIHANQVIEHISNLDHFMAEIYRVLKPKGYVIISTENQSSWHNVGASFMGWQIFSLTNLSSQTGGIGNPLAFFALRGLTEFMEIHNLTVIEKKGAGYYPLPAAIGNIDKNHAHFITVKARKN